MTRIEAARRKVGIARYAIVAGAATALAVFAGLARASHPATRSSSTTSAATAPATDDRSSFFNSGSGSNTYVGPSGSAQPQVQSGAS